MYRIELSPGEETAFRSIEELAVAIRRGVVTAKARIWHNASSKWLPIQFHPHYKTAREMPLTQADLVVGPRVTPLSALSLPDPNSPAPRVTGFRPIDPSPRPELPAAPPRVTPFIPASPYHQPEPPLPPSPVAGLPLIEPVRSAAPPRVTPFIPASPYHQPEPPLPPSPVAGLPLIEPVRAMSPPPPVKSDPVRPQSFRPEPVLPFPPRPVPPRPAVSIARPVEKKKEKRPRSRKSSRRALRVAFIGALFLGGAHLAVSASGALRPETLRSHRRLVAAPPEVTKTDSPRTVAAVIPTLRNSSVPGGNRLPTGAPRPQPTLRTPAPTLGAVTRASLPATMPPEDSAPEIQAAPKVETPVPTPAAADSLASSVTDSSGKRVLKGILKAVSGSSTPAPSRPKR